MASGVRTMTVSVLRLASGRLLYVLACSGVDLKMDNIRKPSLSERGCEWCSCADKRKELDLRAHADGSGV